MVRWRNGSGADELTGLPRWPAFCCLHVVVRCKFVTLLERSHEPVARGRIGPRVLSACPAASLLLFSLRKGIS